MKRHTKFKILKILGIILIILSFINIDLTKNPFYFPQHKPKNSATYYDIEINDLPSSSFNWDWARTQPWCTQGSGTEGNPYIIDGETFRSSGSGNGLLIENSRKYFKIISCYFEFSGFDAAGLRMNNVSNAQIGELGGYNFFNKNSYGIYSYNCSNNIIQHNNISDNAYDGIYVGGFSKKNKLMNNYMDRNNESGIRFYDSEYIEIYGNIIEHSDYGVYASSSPHNRFSNNILKNNYHMGFLSENYCYNNSFFNNTANNNTGYGFDLSRSDNIILSGNTANDNIYGIYSWECDNINITGNFIKRNLNFGIVVSSSENNSIVKNKAEYNDYGGIQLGGSFNSTLLDNVANYSRYGISIGYSNKTNILANKANHNKYNGISIQGGCYNINIIGNSAYNNSEGINVDSFDMECYYFNISENSINNNKGSGIFTYILNNSTISNNILTNNSYFGIFLAWSLDNILYENKMYNCGLNVYGPREYMLSNDINITNLVNDKPLYVYKRENGLTPSNFSNAGQIILINCNNSKISNINVSYCSRGILLYECENNTLSSFNASHNSIEGIRLWWSNYNEISGINASFNLRNGIYLEYSQNNTISNNIVSNNEWSGIYLAYGCNYNNISKNNLSNNGVAGIHIDTCHYLNISNNLMINCGLEITGYSWDLTTFSSNSIDTSNKVNEKPLYYYVSESNLGSNNFTNAGQIILIACNDSIISEFTISHSTYGLNLFFCKNDQIMNNNFSNNLLAGLRIEKCSNVTIFGNIANINDYAGIWVDDSDNNIISGNNISNNTENGIHLDWGSDSNKIYYNNIYGGAFDDGSNNTWDDGYAGNFWDDYTGIDANNDGIGDSNYSISGYVKSNDTKPLMYPTYEDTDGEGLINYEEYTLGLDGYRTNVTNPDSDYDGLSDYWEWLNATNPSESDTDFDGMPDYWEVVNSLDPLVNDAMDDPDFDDLKNIYEFQNGTNPHNNDTDSDNMPDGLEVINSLDPLVDDAMDDPDFDDLENIYELHNGTNPHNPDTDTDTFLDGVEVKKHTNPLNRWWYPMPNLAVLEFEAKAVKEGEPFTLNFTIINNGIWRAENVIIMIRLELLNQTLYTNIDKPIDLEINETYQDLIQCTGVQASGGLVMEIILDPLDLINETYSNQDGSLRTNCEGDNSREVELQITGGGFDPLWIIIIIISGVAFFAIIGTYIVMRPRFKRRALIKRQIQSAKDDIENFEHNFRSFIKAELQTYYKDKWWQDGIPTYIKNTIETQIKAEKIKVPSKAVDKMDFLDFTHYHPIITEKNNWENTFSKTFSDKTIIEENLEKLRVFKRNLYEGKIITEEMNNYPLYVHAIRNYISKGFNVFLSYSTLDADYFKINEIVERLQSYPDIDKVFFWEADSGENIVTFMERTLKMSKVFVLFCSEKSLKSKAVEDEWQAAFQLRKKGLMKIVPVYEKEELIPYLLMPLLNVKFSKDDFDGFIEKLYEEILR